MKLLRLSIIEVIWVSSLPLFSLHSSVRRVSYCRFLVAQLLDYFYLLKYGNQAVLPPLADSQMHR